MKLLILYLSLPGSVLGNERVLIEKSYKLDSPEDFTVVVDNLYGDILIEPSTDNTIYLSLEIHISARSEESMIRAKEELKLGEELSNDSLVLFTEAPFMKRFEWGKSRHYEIRRGPSYEFKYQYKLRVPKTTAVFAKTVNRGDITIKDMKGSVKAGNVNGEIDIINAVNVQYASTVNGDVSINFLESPKESINFNTVNGDFEFELPDDFKAKVYFDTMNGNIYSSFDYQNLSPRVKKTNRNGQFKIEAKGGVEIGSGGPELSFKSINGNVYLKKAG